MVMDCPIAKYMASLHSMSPLRRISCEQWKMTSLDLFARNISQDMERPSGNMAGREVQTPHIVLQSVAWTSAGEIHACSEHGHRWSSVLPKKTATVVKDHRGLLPSYHIYKFRHGFHGHAVYSVLSKPSLAVWIESGSIYHRDLCLFSPWECLHRHFKFPFEPGCVSL